MSCKIIPVIGKQAVLRGAEHAFSQVLTNFIDYMHDADWTCDDDCEPIDFENGVNAAMCAVIRAISDARTQFGNGEDLPDSTVNNLPGRP